MSERKDGSDLVCLPTAFGEVEGDVAVAQSGAAYVTFLSSNAQSYQAIVSRYPGLGECTPVLIRPGEEPIKLVPFDFFVDRLVQFWGKYDDNSKLLATCARKKEGFHETFETVILVILPDGTGLVPAQTRFKRTRCGPIIKAAEALAAVKTPEWAKRSPDHAFTLRISQPGLRYFVRAGVKDRTNVVKQRVYQVLEGAIRPTGGPQVVLLNNFSGDKEGLRQLEDARHVYRQRVAEVRGLAVCE